jgi:membrane-bound lytic murein transglycosylase D
VGLRRAIRGLFVAVLCCTAQAALAVDPVLHNLPILLPDEAPPDAPLLVSSLKVVHADDPARIDVIEVIDLVAWPDGYPPGGPVGNLWDRIRAGFAMPTLESSTVTRQQAAYARNPELLNKMVQRSRPYLFYIVEEIERRGMPTELALLPMVESAFNPMAYSRAHASGLWQFIPSTGRNYNLDQNWWYDDRRDIVASTNAALDYLQNLYRTYGDWHLALASYNFGENGVARAIKRNQARGKPTDFSNLRMPQETRNYVPRLQALKNIIARPGDFGLELEPIPDAPYFVTIALKRDIDLRIAAQLAEMPVEDLIALNPGHNRPVVATAVAPTLILPTDRADTFVRNLENHSEPLSSWRTYTFNSGDSLAKIAAAHGISENRLRQVNGLGRYSHVKVGHELLVPAEGATISAEPLPLFRSPYTTPSGPTMVYRVRAGDSLWSIARRHRVSVGELRAWNGIDGKTLRIGQRLLIEVRGTPAPRQVARPSASS